MSEKQSGMQSLLNGTELGAYTIIRMIGRGGMGEVYEAYEQRLQRRVAIKVISQAKAEENGDGDVVRRFLQEARTLAQVNHPNIVTIFAIDKINDTQFIAMEFVDGALLKDIFSLFVLSADEAAPMFIQMLEGLRALHENKILHRDLKPHNLMLRANGQIKIFDFGIAKREGDTHAEKTSAGIVVGTLAYLPPEVLFGEPASPRSDLWSLGAIFYECLTGQPLVNLHNIKIKGVRAAADSEVVFPAETLSWIPEEMRQIVARLCEKDPMKRYSSAALVIDDLKRYQASRPLVGGNVFNSLAKAVNNIAQLKAKIDPKASRDPKMKRALALAQITGATSIRSEPESLPAEESKVIITEMRDSVTGRRRARKQRRRKIESQSWWTRSLAGGVVALLLLALWFKFKSAPSIEKIEVVNESPVQAITPADHQDLWLDAIQSPNFIWSRSLAQGDYELQISTDEKDSRVLSTDPVQGKFMHLEHALPEGRFQWRLVPMRGQPDAVQARHFTISYLTRVELTQPENLAVLDVAATGKLGLFGADLRWKCKLGATQYKIQIFADSNKVTPVRETVTRECAFKEPGLPAGTYDWQVRVEEPQLARGSWSELRRLTLHGTLQAPAPVAAPAAAETPKFKAVTRVTPAPSGTPFVARVPQLRTAQVTMTLHFTGKQIQSAPVLRWLPVKGAEAYQIEITGANDQLLLDERLSETEFVWKHAVPGSHHWRVLAIDATGASSKFSAKAKLEVRLPAPEFVAGKKDGIAWNEVPLAGKYILQTSTTKNMSPVGEILTAKTQVKVASGTKLTYVRVAAADSNGARVSDFSNLTTVQPLPATAGIPEGPALQTPPQGAHPHVGKSGRMSVLFSWEKVYDAIAYQLEVASDENFTQMIHKEEVQGSHGYLLKEAELKGPVYWRVRAVFPQGRSPASNSSWSVTRNFEVR